MARRTKLEQMFSVVTATAGVHDILDIDFSFVSDTVNVRGASVPRNVSNTTTRLIVPASNVHHLTLLSTPAYKQC